MIVEHDFHMVRPETAKLLVWYFSATLFQTLGSALLAFVTSQMLLRMARPPELFMTWSAQLCSHQIIIILKHTHFAAHLWRLVPISLSHLSLIRLHWVPKSL